MIAKNDFLSCKAGGGVTSFKKQKSKINSRLDNSQTDIGHAVKREEIKMFLESPVSEREKDKRV